MKLTLLKWLIKPFLIDDEQRIERIKELCIDQPYTTTLKVQGDSMPVTLSLQNGILYCDIYQDGTVINLEEFIRADRSYLIYFYNALFPGIPSVQYLFST